MSLVSKTCHCRLHLFLLLLSCEYLRETAQVTSLETTEHCTSPSKTVSANSSVTFPCVSTVNTSDVFFRWERLIGHSWDLVYFKNKLKNNSTQNVLVDTTNRRTYLHIFSAQMSDAGLYLCSTLDRTSRMRKNESYFDLTVIDGDLNRSCSIQQNTMSFEDENVNVTCSMNVAGKAIPSLKCHNSLSSSIVNSTLNNGTAVHTLNAVITVNTVPSSDEISCTLLSNDCNLTGAEPLRVWRLRVRQDEEQNGGHEIKEKIKSNNVVIVVAVLAGFIFMVIVILCVMRIKGYCKRIKPDEDQLQPNDHGRHLQGGGRRVRSFISVAYDGRGGGQNDMNSFGIISWSRQDAINQRMQQAAGADNVGRLHAPSAPSLNENAILSPNYNGYPVYEDMNTATVVSAVPTHVPFTKSNPALNRPPATATATTAASAAAADDVYADVSVVPGLAGDRGRQQRQPQREPAVDASLYAAIDHTMTIDFKNVV